MRGNRIFHDRIGLNNQKGQKRHRDGFRKLVITSFWIGVGTHARWIGWTIPTKIGLGIAACGRGLRNTRTHDHEAQ